MQHRMKKKNKSKLFRLKSSFFAQEKKSSLAESVKRAVLMVAPSSLVGALSRGFMRREDIIGEYGTADRQPWLSGY